MFSLSNLSRYLRALREEKAAKGSFCQKTQQERRKLTAEKKRKRRFPLRRIGRECRRTRGVSATNPLGCVVHPTLSDAFFIFSASGELVSVAGSSVRSKGTCGCMVAP